MTLANNIVGYNSTSLLDEADELARSRKWTRSFALYIMFCEAMAVGDKIRAETCMKLLESEVMDELTKPVVLESEREYDQDN
jgi:hypothetical protein